MSRESESHPRERGKRSGKRLRMAVLLLLAAVLLLWLWRGNTVIRTTELTVSGEGLPGAFRGFRIAQVSDLHNARFGEGQRGLLDAIRGAAPDLIAVTGDLVDSRRTGLEAAMEFIRGAVLIAPVYYVTGNHEARVPEYPALEARLREAGVTVLRNEGTELVRDGAVLRLLGLDAPAFSGGGTASLEAALSSLTGGGGYTVLLSHRPELLELYAAYGVDLALCGHAHGGQVRIPFVGGLVAPNQGFFPSYTEGIYQRGKTSMAVSRGLGNSVIPLRVNNPPELLVLTLG